MHEDDNLPAPAVNESNSSPVAQPGSTLVMASPLVDESAIPGQQPESIVHEDDSVPAPAVNESNSTPDAQSEIPSKRVPGAYASSSRPSSPHPDPAAPPPLTHPISEPARGLPKPASKVRCMRWQVV